MKILMNLSYSGLSPTHFCWCAAAAFSAIFHQFQRDGMHYCGVGLRGRAEDIVVGHVHDRCVGGEAKAYVSPALTSIPDAELAFSDQHSLAFPPESRLE